MDGCISTNNPIERATNGTRPHAVLPRSATSSSSVFSISEPPAGWVSLDAVREAVISVVQGDHYQRNGVHARSLADDVCTDLTPRPPTLQERIEKRFYNELRKPGTGLDLDVLAAVAVEECQKESQ